VGKVDRDFEDEQKDQRAHPQNKKEQAVEAIDDMALQGGDGQDKAYEESARAAQVGAQGGIAGEDAHQASRQQAADYDGAVLVEEIGGPQQEEDQEQSKAGKEVMEAIEEIEEVDQAHDPEEGEEKGAQGKEDGFGGRQHFQAKAVVIGRGGHRGLEGDAEIAVEVQEVLEKAQSQDQAGAEEEAAHLQRNHVHVLADLVPEDQEEGNAGNEGEAYYYSVN